MLNLTLEQVKAYQKDYTAVPVAKECFADMTTPLAFLSTVKGSSNDYFLLESLEGGERWGRYSFIGYDPIVKLRAKDSMVEVINSAKVKFKSDNPINCIKEVLAEYKV